MGTDATTEPTGQTPADVTPVDAGPVARKPAPWEDRPGYVAVIYCHGMGSQRRYEETSRLIDSLDRYGNATGERRIGSIEAHPEPSRTTPGAIVGYISSSWSHRVDAKWRDFKMVRFYEIYWAPVMAGQKSPWRVLRWIAAQVLRPWKTVGTPWRERQRLRRATLAAMFEPGRPVWRIATPADFATLVRDYDAYEGLPAQRVRGSGDFAGFLALIAGTHAADPAAVARLQRIARMWRVRYLFDECRNGFVLLTGAVGGALAFAGLAAVVLAVLQRLTATHFAPGPLGDLLGAIKADWKTAGSIAVSALGLIGIGRFLTDAMGDVEAWSTYRETDDKHVSRDKIKATAIDVITHVLADPNCARVVMVSHSLGTTIANDSLLALAQGNRAVHPADPILGPPDLRRIEHFVTMGSPIDKVEYFFESYSSQSHRYKRVTEEMRGDIGTEPFSRNRTPVLHWVNFWDAGDLVSGALQSPLNATRVAAKVDNVQVRNCRFPDPAESHLGYLDHRDVIAALFEMIYRRTGSYATLPAVEGVGKAYDSLALGPGMRTSATTRAFQSVALALPWLALGGALATLLGGDAIVANTPATVAAGILLVGYTVGRMRGRLHGI